MTHRASLHSGEHLLCQGILCGANLWGGVPVSDAEICGDNLLAVEAILPKMIMRVRHESNQDWLREGV